MKIPRKLKKRIPKGSYCYQHKKGKYHCCPFWSIDKNREQQANGYCSLMKKGDWNIHEETQITDLKTGQSIDKNDLPFSLGLLWDQVKECDINKDY